MARLESSAATMAANTQSSRWTTRDVLAAAYIVTCIFFVWLMSLLNLLFLKHFPDRAYAYKASEHDVGPFGDHFFRREELSYYGPRWMWFAPHVFSAIVWWNLSWLQLMKSIRAKHLWIHRWNGRVQVTAMLGQIITGTALACKSPTPGIRMLAIAYGIAMAYVLGQTVYHIMRKDIVRHKYWATKLFGYAQAIALQRVYLFAFFVLTMNGMSLYTPPDQLTSQAEKDDETLLIFNDSFTMCIFSAIVLCEWYQAADHNDLLEYRVKEAKANGPKMLTQPLMT